ncbi:hypothetical protein Trydic_g18550 [Trypoxylus dichotomus]
MHNFNMIPTFTFDYFGKLGDTEEHIPIRAHSSRETDSINTAEEAETEKKMMPRVFRGRAICLSTHRRENSLVQDTDDSDSNFPDKMNISYEEDSPKSCGKFIRNICKALRSWFVKFFTNREQASENDEEIAMEMQVKEREILSMQRMLFKRFFEF